MAYDVLFDLPPIVHHHGEGFATQVGRTRNQKIGLFDANSRGDQLLRVDQSSIQVRIYFFGYRHWIHPSRRDLDVTHFTESFLVQDKGYIFRMAEIDALHGAPCCACRHETHFQPIHTGVATFGSLIGLLSEGAGDPKIVLAIIVTRCIAVTA
jgi:hypothetical protein